MTTKIWLVDFSNGFHTHNVVANTTAQAVRIATKLFRNETNEYVRKKRAQKRPRSSYSTWKTYINNGWTKPTNVELIAESDN